MESKVITGSKTDGSKIVERELLRKRLYEDNILGWLVKQLPGLRFKEVYHLLLRYIFNKNITKLPTDDPVFIVTRSPIAEDQLRKDFIYNNKQSYNNTQSYNTRDKITADCNVIIEELEKRFNKCATQMNDKNIRTDRNVSLTDKGKIMYGTWLYTDISGLAKKNPEHIGYALALNIRYTYLKLLNHGLARTFDDMGYKPSDATEGFASAFNHYFDRFCSAFPDLERPFGSRGSFFDNNEWETYEVFVNPPFDESLMTCAMNRIYDYLKTAKTKHRFIFTLPNWDNYPELEALKVSPWTVSSRVYKKGELAFIDYMNNKNIIYPCDIAEPVLETKETEHEVETKETEAL